MKTNLLPLRSPKLLAAACGILGLILRLLHTATGTDDKGLLVTRHPAWISLLILSAAVAVVLFRGIGTLRNDTPRRVSPPLSVLSALGNLPAAVWAGISAIRYFRAGPSYQGPPNMVSTMFFWLSCLIILLAAASFALTALYRLLDKNPPFLLDIAICGWFALEMLNLYRTWSFSPQVAAYCFQLFACICLTLTAFHLASLDNGKGSQRGLWFFGMAAVYLCLTSVSSGPLFVTGGIWALASLGDPPIRRRQRPVFTEHI